MARSWASRHPRAYHQLSNGPARILVRAAKIIEQPSRYTNLAEAITVIGTPTSPTSRLAVRWSATGAVRRAARSLHLSSCGVISYLDDGGRRAKLPADQSTWTLDQAQTAMLWAIDYCDWHWPSQVLRRAKHIIELCHRSKTTFHHYLVGCGLTRWPTRDPFHIYRLLMQAAWSIGGEQPDEDHAADELDKAARDMGFKGYVELYEATGEVGLLAAIDWAIAVAHFDEQHYLLPACRRNVC